MTIKLAQTELPVGLRGGSDTWDQPQASVVLDADFFSEPASSGGQSLSPTRFDNASTFYPPTVGRGAVTLSPARLDNVQAFYTPTVGRGAVTLSPVRLDNTQAFYAPTVGRGAVALQPALLVNANEIYAPEVSAAGLPPAQPPPPSEIEPIGGAFNIPTRQQMAEMARKQRIALGILPKPVQKKAKAAAKQIARIAMDGGTVAQVQAALDIIPPAQRVEAMSAVQVSYAYYLAVQAQAQQEIERIQESQRQIAATLAEIERLSIIQREEDDIAFLMMQVVLAE